jgi:hypothetical protein
MGGGKGEEKEVKGERGRGASKKGPPVRSALSGDFVSKGISHCSERGGRGGGSSRK